MMFLVGSKGKHNIGTIFEIPISSLNKNAKYSFSHNFNAIKQWAGNPNNSPGNLGENTKLY